MPHSNTEIDSFFFSGRDFMLCWVTAGWIICYRQESTFPECTWLMVVPWVLRWVSLVCDVKPSSLAVSAARAGNFINQSPTFKKKKKTAGTGYTEKVSYCIQGEKKRPVRIMCSHRVENHCSFTLWFTAASGNTNTVIQKMSAVYEAACFAPWIPSSS